RRGWSCAPFGCSLAFGSSPAPALPRPPAQAGAAGSPRFQSGTFFPDIACSLAFGSSPAPALPRPPAQAGAAGSPRFQSITFFPDIGCSLAFGSSPANQLQRREIGDRSREHQPSARRGAPHPPDACYGSSPIAAIPARTAWASSEPFAPLALNAPTILPSRRSTNPPSYVSAPSIAEIRPSRTAAAYSAVSIPDVMVVLILFIAIS